MKVVFIREDAFCLYKWIDWVSQIASRLRCVWPPSVVKILPAKNIGFSLNL